MNLLVDEFFKRNLTDMEAQSLEDLLEKSPEEALRFGERMKREYFAMGLPVPEIPRNLRMIPASTSRFVLSLWGMSLLAAAGVLLWHYWPSNPNNLPKTETPSMMAPNPIPVESQRRVWSAAPLPPPPLQIPQKLTGTGGEGNRLSVVVELEKSAPVRVFILDGTGKPVRSLFDGDLQEGKWSIRWDGLLNDGSRAPAGDYRIRVQSGASEMNKSVRIEGTTP